MSDEQLLPLTRLASITCPRCRERAPVYLGVILPHKNRIRGYGYDGRSQRVPIDIVVECNADGVTLENPT